MKKIVIALSAMFATMGAVHAQQAPVAPHSAQLRFVGGLGVSAGGDGLAIAQYTNGSSQTIKAGGGVYFTAGADYRVHPQFSVQGTFNFHVDDTSAQNGSIKFQRFPIEVLGYYHINSAWRIGAGVRYVGGAKLSSSGVAAGMETKFDNATSGVIEAEYFWAPNFGMKMRYVNETFEKRGYRDLDANHVGISANYYF